MKNTLLKLAAFCAALLPAPRGKLTGLANIGEGVHETGVLSKRSDGALGRFLLVKPGSDSDHVIVAGAADVPYGATVDEAAAAEGIVGVRLLACSPGTLKVTNDNTGAIAFGDQLVPAANGQVKKIAAGAGNYYVVGVALNAAAAQGDLIEMNPIGSWKTQ